MAQEFLNPIKFKVVQELPEFRGVNNEKDYQKRLNSFKFEVAREVGVPLEPGYNGELTSRQAGVIGGHMGGKIGGHMVRDMIKAFESSIRR